MPKKKRSYGSRLRTRAGSSVRKRWTRIVSEIKKEHKCPTCSSPSVKRKSTGVWRCSVSNSSGFISRVSSRTGRTLGSIDRMILFVFKI